MTHSRTSRGRGRRPGPRLLALLVLSATLAGAGGGVAAALDSSRSTLVSRLLTSSVPRLVSLAHELGSLPASRRLTVTLPLALSDRAALDAYLASEYRPGSPDYHRFLTPRQFGSRFGASPGTVRAALGALRRLGLSTATPSPGHLYVAASGTASTLERTFGVSLARFRLPSGATFFANTHDIRLPAVLSRLVTGVVGLDSSAAVRPELAPLPRPSGTVRAQLQRRLAGISGVSGGATPCPQADLSGAYTAPDLAQGYDFNGLYARGLHGEGMSAALVEFDDYHDSNVTTMESCYGIHTPVTRRLIDGGIGGPPSTGEAEDMADIATLVPLAPRLAHLYVYEAPNSTAGEIDLYGAFVSDDAAPVLSSSWANCEENLNQSYTTLFSAIAEEAAAQGQQILEASGDSGAVDCRGEPTPTSGSISVTYEAAIPWFTAVGGTDLSIESTVRGLGIHHEATWNDAGAGGGGQSSVFAMPSWQASYLAATGDTPPGTADPCGAPGGGRCRMIPDIAMNADPAVGGALNSAGPHPPQFLTEADLGSPGDATYCGTPNCSFLSLLGLPLPIGAPPPGGAGGWYPIGGTSLATPTAAAAAVLWDEQAEHRGLSGGLGFLNPQLYSLAADRTAYARDFHDITTGTNSDQYDATDCPAGCNPQHLYAAVPGYDMATGLGSFDAARLGDDLVAQADRVALTPDSVRLYGYLRGPATTTPVSVTGAPAGESFRASSSARWLRVRRSGRLPGTLSLHADPAGLKQGARSARITVTAADGSRATLSVSYSVGPRARIAVSPGRLRFTERAIDAHGRTIGATCNATTWNDELIDSADFAAGAYVGQPVDPSTKATLKIGNRGPRGSTLHWQADLVAPTGGWLSQDLNPNGNPSGFQTTPQPPLVPTGGTVRGHAAASTLKLASLGDGNALGGYPPMNQGTYAGEVVIRDLANPRVHVIVPAALVLGNGGGTPRIVATPHAISLRLAPGASTTVDLSLSDAGRACGYVYSLQSTAPWTSFAADLQSGTVGASPAGAPPAGASDTGAGNGLTPVTVSAAGLSAGRHTGEIVVASENATGSPYRVPITLTVSR